MQNLSTSKTITVKSKKCATVDSNLFARKRMTQFDSETKNTSNSLVMSSTKTNLFLNKFIFKWPIIALLALSNLCFFILLMSLEETLPPITKGELSLTLSSYSCSLNL